MCVDSNKRPLAILTVCLLVFVCCVLPTLGEVTSRTLDDDGEDEVLTNQRELREYDHESWHAIHNTPEGASGWIPREPTDQRSGVVYTKRRRLRKRKRRPPVVSFADDVFEDNLTPLKTFEEDTENRKEVTVAPLEGQVTPLNGFERQGDFTRPKKRKRPTVREPWEEMQEESVRPYIRRKVTPSYQAPDDSSNANDSTLGASNKNQLTEDTHANHGKPKTTKKKEHHHAEKIESSKTFRPPTSRTPNIKAILKQNGGLSLSEILQQKNLTLSQLLTGNQEAIKALTESPEVTTPSSTVNYQNNLSENLISSTQKSTRFSESLDNSKYTRLPPSVALKKNINRKYEHYGDSHESLSDRELLEAQRKRLALLQGNSYAQNGKFSEVTRYEVITEPTTEKRIFVPSHPNLYTSIDYKQELSKVTATEPYKFETSTTQKSTTEPSNQVTTATTQKSEFTTQSTEPTNTLKTLFTKTKFALPLTSAKLIKPLSKRVTPTKEPFTPAQESLIMEEENYPMTFKPLKIDLKDVLGFLNSENRPEEKVSDGPYRMNIDLDTILDKPSPKLPEQSPTKTTVSSSTTTESVTASTSTSTQASEKLKPFSAKDEIQEILKDPTGKERLAKILEARNMTIEELIEQRERGSSQLHLADIFHNKTKEPEPLEVAFEGRISSEVFTSFPVFVRQPKALLAEAQITQIPVKVSTTPSNILVSAFPSFKIEVPKDLPKDIDSSQPTFPWKQLYPDLFNLQDQNKDIVVVSGVQEVPHNRIELLPNKDISAEILTDEDIQRLDDLDQKLLSAVSSEQLNIVDEKVHKIIKIPSGVQSAIIASLVIVGLSLIVFMTILVIFRWTQKKKTQMKYSDSLKPPLFEKSRNIKTFVAKTLDKTKINYYRNNLQSMSDVWDRESERKSAF